MHAGHGDDLYSYPDIRINFSSNVFNHFCHDGLYAHLTSCLSAVTHYPEPTPRHLEAVLAAHLGLQPEEVMVTNGATEAIYLVAQFFAGSRHAIAGPTFSEYADACRIHGATIDYLFSDVLATQAPVLWLCNPNNPTGTVIPREALLSFVGQHPQTTLVLDASYAPFTDQALPEVSEAVHHRNLIMLHSMTKHFAVPGLRLGYITAHPSVLQRLRPLQMPWSVNSLAIEAAHYLIRHEQDYHLPLQELLSERRRMADALHRMGGITTSPSDTHILLCRLRQGSAAHLKEQLAHDHHILIRDASNFAGLSPAHFRIAVQTPAENDALLRALNTLFL